MIVMTIMVITTDFVYSMASNGYPALPGWADLWTAGAPGLVIAAGQAPQKRDPTARRGRLGHPSIFTEGICTESVSSCRRKKAGAFGPGLLLTTLVAEEQDAR